MNLYDLIFNCLERKGLEPKLKKELLNNSIFLKLCDFISNMFEYENIPDGLDTRLLELYAMFTGFFGAWKKYDGKYQVGFITLSGKLDSNYNPIYVNIFTGNTTKKQKALVNNDCVIGWNNSLRTSDITLIADFCELLTETQISIKTTTIGSRLNKMYKCSNDSVKRNIDNAINNSKVGKPITFIGKNPLEEITGAKDVEQIDLFNTDEVQKIQYLTSSYNDILKMFFFYYGLTMGEGNKRAQQSVEEITNSSDASLVFSDSRLKARKEFCERFNKLYGTNLIVKYSESWNNARGVIYEK